MDLELVIQAWGRDADELMHRLRLELMAALRDLPETRRRIEAAQPGEVASWIHRVFPDRNRIERES